QGRYTKAEPLYQQALAIKKQQLGENHPSTATSLNNLAGLYESQGRYTEAEPLLQQALAINKEQLGENHPDTASSVNNLAVLYKSQGRYTEAEPLLQQALAIRKEQLGGNHPDTANSLNNLAVLYESQGNISQAFHYLTQALEIEEYNLSENLNTGDEKQKREYMETVSDTTNTVISLNLQSAPNNPQARQLALKTILQRKGRILDILANRLQILRQQTDDPESQQLLAQLIDIRTQQANLTFTPVDKFPSPDVYGQLLADVQQKSQQLEDKISRHSAKFRNLSQPITLEAIQQQIPSNAALVEIVRYQPFKSQATEDNERWGNARYAVYILFPNGEIKAKDLGEAQPIDEDVTYFRDNLRDGQSSIPQVKYSARQLDAKLMAPIRELLGETKTILLSPDAELNSIPFEALVMENEQYLVEDYKISYLTTGRDLLRLKDKFSSQQPPLIIADPIYNQEKKSVNVDVGLNRSIDLSKLMTLSPLPGTKEEADALSTIFPQSIVLTQSQATENAVKQAKRPQILHIATHGFFLNRSLLDSNNSQSSQNIDNPLLQSGLVLTGVDINKSAENDGVLTALETTNLNLLGTKLVVFSACDIGVGDTTTGEGVYGLRRALVIAGSESQLISLWKVADEQTKDLMVDYYQRLKQGENRHEALRQIQLSMLKSKTQHHPYYWSSFIPVGDWTPINFEE
nr:CHAT domain-containing protein [Crocosphaera sp.]